MKIFSDFEAVKFPEENIIFVTHSGYLYYIYNIKYKHWKKHSNAGNDLITVSKYDEVSREEIMDATLGIFPRKETDFMRLCNSSELCIRDMLDLLKEDYSRYMSDGSIVHTVHTLLLESDICHKSFLEVKKIFDNATALRLNNKQVLVQIKELCFTIIGRDIFKQEIGIVDGHDSSSYFWIMPARVIDYSDTNSADNVAEMRSTEISIEEDDVFNYLTPFLYKYYDDELEANKKRVDSCWIDDNGKEQLSFVGGFEWYLTHNFFTFKSMLDILQDISDTIDALSSGGENEFIVKLREKRGAVAEEELIIDFYRRFIYRMEYMMNIGEEKGYDLISFMGP
ncbi:MAG: hypothetical protein PHE51_05965 [Eubacteriales bacterium]|nr:hypothetical protein [Eubacteriales bacterium]